MPKLGMEPLRREAVVKATIAEIGAAGSLDVTVSQIARRAGISSALAHHYFGGKTQIFLAAMRHILEEFRSEVRAELSRSPQKRRAEAIIRASFAPSCFTPDTICAWMTFYVLAQTDDQAMRLWQIYQRRMRSNLIHALRPVSPNPKFAADTLVALIDGLYIRTALNGADASDIAIEQALQMLSLLKGQIT